MAGPLLFDRVHETSITTGTGAFALSGAIVGHRTFASVLSVGDTFPYCIAAQGGTEWEVGIGTLSASTTLTRTTVLASSNSGSAVNFTAGTKDCFLCYQASRAVLKTGALTSARIPYVSANGELTDSSSFVFNGSLVGLGSGALDVGYKLNLIDSGPTTAGVQIIAALGYNSTGTPAAGLGSGLVLLAESTTTENRPQALIASAWVTATDASRAADLILYAYSTTSNQEGLRVRGNSGGVQIGVFGVTPVARTAAYTQTYSTATRVHSNLTSATLTDATTGTADSSVQDYTASYNQVRCNNNAADMVAQINALRVDLANIKQVVNQVIDDLQAYGWLQ